MQEKDPEGDRGTAAPATGAGEGVLEDPDSLRLYNGDKHVATLKGLLEPPERLILDDLRVVIHRYRKFVWEHLQALLSLQGANTAQLLGERFIITGGKARPAHAPQPGYDTPTVLEILENPKKLSVAEIFYAYTGGGYY